MSSDHICTFITLSYKGSTVTLRNLQLDLFDYDKPQIYKFTLFGENSSVPRIAKMLCGHDAVVSIKLQPIVLQTTINKNRDYLTTSKETVIPVDQWEFVEVETPDVRKVANKRLYRLLKRFSLLHVRFHKRTTK